MTRQYPKRPPSRRRRPVVLMLLACIVTLAILIAILTVMSHGDLGSLLQQNQQPVTFQQTINFGGAKSQEYSFTYSGLTQVTITGIDLGDNDGPLTIYPNPLPFRFGQVTVNAWQATWSLPGGGPPCLHIAVVDDNLKSVFYYGHRLSDTATPTVTKEIVVIFKHPLTDAEIQATSKEAANGYLAVSTVCS